MPRRITSLALFAMADLRELQIASGAPNSWRLAA